MTTRRPSRGLVTLALLLLPCGAVPGGEILSMLSSAEASLGESHRRVLEVQTFLARGSRSRAVLDETEMRVQALLTMTDSITATLSTLVRHIPAGNKDVARQQLPTKASSRRLLSANDEQCAVVDQSVTQSCAVVPPPEIGPEASKLHFEVELKGNCSNPKAVFYPQREQIDLGRSTMRRLGNAQQCSESAPFLVPNVVANVVTKGTCHFPAETKEQCLRWARKTQEENYTEAATVFQDTIVWGLPSVTVSSIGGETIPPETATHLSTC